jgi:diaminopimelate decarboxylase
VSEFAYRDGELHAEDVPLTRIAAEVGTPFYCYSSGALAARYLAFAEAFRDLPATICFALKANSNLAVVRTLADLGAGADVVSEGELRQALAGGVAPDKIVFSGVGKTDSEIRAALEAGILQVNVESMAELFDVDRLARALGVRAPVALRINPDIDVNTHAKIATATSETKFGIDLGHAREAFARAAGLAGIAVQGIAVHIGSQLTELDPFRSAFRCVAELTEALRGDGIEVRRLDLGGGLGITYDRETPPEPADYAALVAELLGPLGCELVLEPGRCLVGNAGVLVTRVVRVKEGITHRFVIVDSGMNDLLRPALYDAYHRITPVAEPAAGASLTPVEVVGPVCETGDSFASDRALPSLGAGDLLAIESAGAYGAVMASSYNTRPPAPEVLVRGTDFAVVRPRPGCDEMLARDRLPDWLSGGSPRARLKKA